MSQQEDLFALYFRLRELTEPPVIFHRWSLVTCLSAYLGRQYWFPFGAQRIFPNFYTMLIGHPGARKSTAIKLGKKLIGTAGYESYAAEKTSKEKFLLDLEGATEEDLLAISGRGRRRTDVKGLTPSELHETLFGKESTNEIKEPKEVFIVADEFNEFVGSGNLEFLSLLGALWDWDDTENDYKYRLKNSKSVSIYQPTISILSGNTHAGFMEAFPPQAIGQGFLSRLILVYGEPSGKKITFPGPENEKLKEQILSRLIEIKRLVVGEATLSKDARHALDIIYRTWKELEDSRFKHYSTRRFTHLIKLCLVVAASRCSVEINERDVVYANTILCYTEGDMPKALGEFGKSKDSEIAGKIMAALYETTKPMSPTELLKLVKNDLDKHAQLSDLLAKLQNSGQIQYIKGVGYLAQIKPPDSRQMYVEFDLLREYNIKHGLRRVK